MLQKELIIGVLDLLVTAFAIYFWIKHERKLDAGARVLRWVIVVSTGAGAWLQRGPKVEQHMFLYLGLVFVSMFFLFFSDASYYLALGISKLFNKGGRPSGS